MEPASTIRGHLDVMLLAVLGLGPAHGYAVIEELRVRSQGLFDLAEGTVYPALHRLEQEGLLASGWVDGRGRRRRVYELTSRGRARLGARRRAWSDFAAAVDAVLEEPSCAPTG